MNIVHVYTNANNDWTVVVMNGKRMYTGHESIGYLFDQVMRHLEVKVVRHCGEFVEDDDRRFREGTEEIRLP